MKDDNQIPLNLFYDEARPVPDIVRRVFGAEPIPEGHRNPTCFDAFCQLRDCRYEWDEVERAVGMVCDRDDFNYAEASKIWNNVHKREAREPIHDGTIGKEAEVGNSQAKPKPSSLITPLAVTPELKGELPKPFPNQLELMIAFKPGEYVGITHAKWDKKEEKFRPADEGKTYLREDLLKRLKSKTIQEIFPETHGYYIRLNPMVRDGSHSYDVVAYRHALIEFDQQRLDQQYHALIESGVPIAAIIYSGDKSIHAWVKVNAATLDEYRKRVKILHELFKSYGVDPGNSDPGRYSRLPGAMRDGKEQSLLALNAGVETWEEFEVRIKRSQIFLSLFKASFSGEQFNSLKIPPRISIIKDWLKEGDLGFIYAYRGSGKTWLVLSLASAFAEGSVAGPWQVYGQWPTMYVDGEMPASDTQSRIRDLNGGIVPENLYVINHEILYEENGTVLNLAEPQHQQALLQLLLQKGIRVLILDNLGCLFSGVAENEADEWEKVLPWLLELRRARIAVIIIHHTGHDITRMRGTVRREDSAAFSIRLDDKKEGFNQAGAHFITRFRKYRGSQVLHDYEWEYKPVYGLDGSSRVEVIHREANQADIVLQWIEDGLNTCTDIANEMGLSKGYISKLASRLIQENKIRKRGRIYEVINPEKAETKPEGSETEI